MKRNQFMALASAMAASIVAQARNSAPLGFDPVNMAVSANKMAKEAQEQQQKERPYITTQAAWDDDDSQEYGGQADILAVNIGEVAGPFEYVGHQPMVMEGGKTVTVHLGIDPAGENVRLPIAASFLRAIDQAEVMKGDKFLIRRGDDVKKKSGIGKGTNMQIFAIKVISRAPRNPAPAPATPAA